MSQDNNPYDAPESNLDLQSSGLRDDASRWLRLFAAIIDGVITSIITVPLMFHYKVFDTLMAGNELDYQYTLFFVLIEFVIFMLIQGYLLKTKGQTVGKMLLGIKIVDLDGKLLPFGKLISLRYLPQWALQLFPAISILALVDILFIFRSDRRCVHDLIAGTKVVRIIK